MGECKTLMTGMLSLTRPCKKKYNITQYDCCRNFKLLTEEQWKKITL